MDLSLTILNLAGSVALLLWGVHMARTGVQRAFGAKLRSALGGALRNRLAAFAAGLGVTAVLQSSTATGLMVASFAAGGFVDLTAALAVMLGANVGTTLIVQALSFDVAEIAPALILVGVILFRRAAAAPRDLGRAAIGLGLMLMALHQLLGLLTPYEDVPSLRLLLGAIATEPVLDVIVAAGLTWATHSSAAVVLVIMSLAAKGTAPPLAALAMALGANLGAALNPWFEGVSDADPAARRVALGNLINRAVGVAVALAFLSTISRFLVTVESDNARLVADFHTAFNVVLALVFMPLLTPFAALLKRMLPARVDPADPSRPLYLDPAAAEAPAIALGGAAREALRLADALEAMLDGMRDALANPDRRQIGDDVLDKLNAAIKAYLTGLDPEALSAADHRRLRDILTFSTNLEQAGDIVDRGLLAMATKMAKRGVVFSESGRDEILRIVDRLIANVRTAASLFMTGDERAARQLAAEKEAFRALEVDATDAHFERLRSGRVDSAETSALHLDALRDLKAVNTHIVAAAAYPVLASRGELLSTRIRGDA
jgi:phosphate:Na+ symporter